MSPTLADAKRNTETMIKSLEEPDKFFPQNQAIGKAQDEKSSVHTNHSPSSKNSSNSKFII